MKIRLSAAPLVLIFAATASWSAGSRGRAGFARASFGRTPAPRSFAHPTFASRSRFAPAFRSSGAFGHGFSRGLKATPVPPSLPAGGSSQTTGGAAAAGPFVGTANNTLVEAAGDARTMTTYGGGEIAYNPLRSQYITNAPGAFVGAADKPQTANPTWGAASGGASGLNGVFANSGQ